MSKLTPMCTCGSYENAFDAALRLYKTMVRNDCAIWHTAVTANLAMLTRMGIASSTVMVMRDEHPDVDTLTAMQEASKVFDHLHFRCVEVSSHDQDLRNQAADAIKEKYDDTYDDIFRMGPPTGDPLDELLTVILKAAQKRD